MNGWESLNTHQNSHLLYHWHLLYRWHFIDIDIYIYRHLILSQSHFLKITNSFYFSILMHKSESVYFSQKKGIFGVNETLLWHFNFPLAKLLMLPHALIKSWCKPGTTETWLWYHLPLTGCQVWIMSWWVRDCIRHLGDTVNSGWTRARSTVKSRHTSCLPGFQCCLSSSGSCR